MKNTTTEMESTLEGINSKIHEIEEWISELKDRMVEIMKNEWKEIKTVSEISWTTLNAPTFEL